MSLGNGSMEAAEGALMKTALTSVFVDDPVKSFTFYTERHRKSRMGPGCCVSQTATSFSSVKSSGGFVRDPVDGTGVVVGD